MFSYKINVTLPVNFKRSDCLHFRSEYSIFPLKILTLKKITATYDGICFKNSQLIRESVQAYPDKIRIFELGAQLQFANQPFVSYSGEKPYLLIHHPWLNYYHWLTEAIPRIWLVRNHLSELILLLPEYYKSVRFVQESLKPFNIKKTEYIPHGCNIKVSNAVVPQIKPVCSSYDPDVLSAIRSFYIEHAKTKRIKTPVSGERIYIMRGNNPRRRILNEERLMKVLENHNFRSVRAESYSFPEQVLIAENTTYLISNGSGLTNMHFMRQGSSVMELQKRITNMNDFHDKVLWHLSSALNLKYFYFICEPEDKEQDMYTANLKINIKRFEKLIIRMLNFNS